MFVVDFFASDFSDSLCDIVLRRSAYLCIKEIDSDEVIDAIPSLMEEYDHDENFKIAFCAGILPYTEWLKDYEITRAEILGDMK